MTANERVALHYERKAKRLHNALGAMCVVWAMKAREGKVNPLIWRIKRIIGEI